MTTYMKPDALLWIDVETTGLDPEHDQILEIAIRCTDPHAETTLGACHRIIRPHHLDLTVMEIIDADPQANSPEAARNAIEETIESLAQRFHLIPAGSNPAFDLAFTHTAGYRIEHLLDHRRYDLSTLRWQRRFAHLPDPMADNHATSHRAPDCIQRDINEYRHTIQKEINQ